MAYEDSGLRLSIRRGDQEYIFIIPAAPINFSFIELQSFLNEPVRINIFEEIDGCRAYYMDDNLAFSEFGKMRLRQVADYFGILVKESAL